ncbi:PH domain-containing protein [Sphingomonas piscis]|uniref:PH domain-containing protein n=1 Tax=Sphingomonas piscis TaxID=2714943 RepID=A0A6G7YP39_9SPHN|nr:PH domain-containing protein [Sphingomonas piscis]QIK78497.1 PH domain-containing protein [Sphingomonas piscis]
MWSIVAGGAYFAVSGRWGMVAALLGVSLLFFIVAAIIRWLTFSFEVGADEIRINSGLLSRNHRSLPFDRIHDVEISQGPVARLLNVAQVRLDTGAAAPKGKDEGSLPAIALAQAEQLRQLVRLRHGGVAPKSMPTSAHGHAREADGEPIYAMSFRRLLLAGLFNFSLALFAALAGAFNTFDGVLNFNPFNPRFWVSYARDLGPVADLLLAHQMAAALAGLLLVAIIGVTTGVVRTVLRDFGFRIDRTEAGLRRRRGLFTRSDVTLQLRRVQAAVIGSGPIRAAFGWRDLRLQSLAQDEGDKDDHLMAPLASADETDGLLQEIGFGQIQGLRGWQRVSVSYVLGFILATTPFYLVAVVQGIFVPLLGIAVACLVAVVQTSRWLAWRHTEFTIAGERLIVRHGWWRRRTTILPARNIQTADLSESFVSRWFGTTSIVLGVAGGSGHRIPAVEREKARGLRLELLSLAS